MNNQTAALFNVTRPNIPPFIQPLVNAYLPDPKKTNTQLDFSLHPESYYGDFNRCSVVLLTHNPGNSTPNWKGSGSQFEANIYQGINPALNYHNMAVQPAFPNPATNRFYNRISSELHGHFEGIQTFKTMPFIRDLIPYHSGEFGKVNMPACTSYLYTYFFNQVINASFNSELYERINAKSIHPTTIIYARGKAWKDANFGLRSVGWEQIGKVFSYCYIFKANFKIIQSLNGFDLNTFSNETLKHYVYIVVITQARKGANYGVYVNNKAPLQPINLSTVIEHYDNGTSNITHNEEMDTFIDIIR